jgi:hypothetical protein
MDGAHEHRARKQDDWPSRRVLSWRLSIAMET